MTPIKCPECGYEMTVKNRGQRPGPTGKPYDWTQYHCKRDDIWIELEVPPETE